MSRSLVRGERARLVDLQIIDLCRIGLSLTGGHRQIFDVCCIGLDANDKLYDERYMIFYNQPVSPCGGLRLLAGAEGKLNAFEVNLSNLPSSIKKLVFTATVDGFGTMNSLSNGALSISA